MGQRDALSFVRMRPPHGELAKNFAWSLLMVKVSKEVGAYLAFASPALAQVVVADRNRVVLRDWGEEYACSVIAASDLDGTHYFDFEANPLVLFETQADVDAVLTGAARFPYEEHLYRFSRTTGLEKIDV